MHQISVCCNGLAPPPPSARQPPLQPIVRRRHSTVTAFAAKSGGFSLNSILKNCQTCGGKGAIECPGCKLLTSIGLDVLTVKDLV
ncbi:uncharacterized protein LOC113865195 isoform X2 [Abrus precatorius]|uniref:Uncharacterized protein LOC113865195 isoform X2 n=1 Tax=Abrus precatorius TaxID=3816 RepID=A0A8B8LKQ6_ABRPR|nr:uncharacterized protein LOC113865195 isoform X2 [Abrus precatorius]